MEKTSGNKKLTKVLCYVGLFFLIVLLLMPPVFRMVFKEEKKEVQKKIVTTMKCSKENENIGSTFLNDEPEVLQYDIVGNYSPIENTGEETNKTGPVVSNNELLDRLLGYGSVTYNEVLGVSIIKVDVSGMKGSDDYELYFRNQPTQEEYFKTQGFSCIKQTIER